MANIDKWPMAKWKLPHGQNMKMAKIDTWLGTNDQKGKGEVANMENEKTDGQNRKMENDYNGKMTKMGYEKKKKRKNGQLGKWPKWKMARIENGQMWKWPEWKMGKWPI